MHTTTVRFDAETWNRVKRRSGELDVAAADFIRIATVQRLERFSLEERLARLEATVGRLGHAVVAVRRVVRGRGGG